MAVDTELYLLYVEEIFDQHGITPCLLTNKYELIEKGISEGFFEEIATRSQHTLRVLRVDTAETLYKITPEEYEMDDIDQEWAEAKFAKPFLDDDFFEE